MADGDSTTPAPRTVYASPCGRVRVVRYGPRDHGLLLDGVCVKSYPHPYQAEHDGGVWLDEQARELAAQLADEQADRDAAASDADLLPTLPVEMEQIYDPEDDFHWLECRVGEATLIFEDTGLIYFGHDDVNRPADLVPIMVLFNDPRIRRRALAAYAQAHGKAA